MTSNSIDSRQEACGAWAGPGRIFLAALAAGLIARGQAIFGGLYSVDGYFVARMSYDDQVAYNLRDGRLLRALLWWVQEALGFAPLASVSASLVLATAAIAAAGVLFAQSLVLQSGRLGVTFFVLLFSLHPFLTEYFYYGEVSFGLALSILFAALAVRLTAQNSLCTKSTLAAVASVFAALSTYQAALGYVLVGFLLATARLDEPNLGRAILRRAMALLGGCALYALSLLALQIIHPSVVGGRAFAVGGVGPAERLYALGQATLRALIPQAGIVATPVAAISVALTLLGVLTVAIDVSRRRGALAAITAGGMTASSLVLACVPSVLPQTPWLALRLLSPSTLAFATLTVASLPADASWRRKVWLACSVAVLLGYFASDASILFDQRRINGWDRQIANRIAARLEDQAGFPGARRLAVIGNLAASPFPLTTSDHDLNVSAFSAPWSKGDVIGEAAGLALEHASKSEIESAKSYCRDRDLWPAPSSVAVVSQLAVVCLSKP